MKVIKGYLKTMFGIINPLSYLIGTLILIIMPGPNSMFCLSVAAQHGARKAYRAICGVLLGDSVLILLTVLGAGTVRDNILAVNPALTDEDLERIAEDSQVGELVARLPHGWEAPAGEWGSQLSGGERQRVGIARALAKPAHLLLVDEATSALDLQAERSVVQALGRVRSDYTTVVVTHRPATVAVADTVVVMEGGRVAEVGTRAELEAAGGLLARFMEEWRAASSWRV